MGLKEAARRDVRVDVVDQRRASGRQRRPHLAEFELEVSGRVHAVVEEEVDLADVGHKAG